MKNSKSVVRKCARMTAQELEATAEEFDREMVIARSKPLTAEERAWWKAVRRRPGRPRRGSGPK